MLAQCMNLKIEKAEDILSHQLVENKIPDQRALKRLEKLQKHQRLTVEYMKRHPSQRGLLIAFGLGSGKTFTGVAVADAFLGHPVLIIGPKHLEYVWQTEMTKYNLANSNKARYSFVAYTDHAKLQSLPHLTSHVVILDEAHHIVELVATMTGGATLYRKLQAAFKILLLTGTPIYNDEHDLPFLINLCSGTSTLPTDRAAFLRKYTKINWKASAFEGYWRPIWNMLGRRIASWASYITLAGMFTDLALPMLAARFVPSLHKPLTQIQLGPRTGTFLWKVAKYPHAAMIYIGTLLFRDLDVYKGRDLSHASLTILTMTTWIVCGINWLVSKALHSDKWQLRTMNVTTLRPVLSKYVSFYERPTGSADYASISSQNVMVNYTSHQLQIFLQFCEETLAPEKVAELNNKHDADSVRLFGSRYLSEMQRDISYGLRIGNLKQGKVWPYKFDKLWELTREGKARTIIYSNFWQHGIMKLQDFLTHKRARYTLLNHTDTPKVLAEKVQRFNKGSTTLLLLHPAMTEGISTTNVRQVHFLEPVVQQAVRDQVIARAVRFQSHKGLPKADRTVTVYTHVVTLDGNGMAMALQQLKQWRQFKREYLPGAIKVKNNYRELKSPVNQDLLLSPDVIQLQRSTAFGKNVQALLAAMREHCIERS